MNSTRELAEKIDSYTRSELTGDYEIWLNGVAELITSHCEQVAREAKREMRESASRKFQEMVRAAAPGLLLDYNAVDVALRTLPLDALTGIQNACSCTYEYNCPLHLNPAQRSAPCRGLQQYARYFGQAREQIIDDPRSPDGKSVTDGNWEDAGETAAQSEMCRLCGCRGVRTTGACTCVCHFGLSDAEPGDKRS